MIKRIVFCALRDNNGATGGPGGVLFLQQNVLGKELADLKCEYWFNPFRIQRDVFRFNRLGMFFKILFTKDTYFVAHEVTTGSLLALLHKRYSLIFHNQGPLVEEYINFGSNADSRKINIIKSRERRAFINANSVHFPSNGAVEMYFNSQHASCKRAEVTVGKSLFNIILPQTVTEPSNFDLKKENDILTFFSLGTLTQAKGQDQSMIFVENFLNFYKGKVRYIIVGKGHLKNVLDDGLKKLSERYSSFSYHLIDAVPHQTVMFLHQISDIYIMLHRISIFDFATLEAMSQGNAIVLSKVGGNIDFDKTDNILFSEDYQDKMDEFAYLDFFFYKKKNKEVFEKFFSKTAFREQYISFVNDVVKLSR